jgi:hypothetical protein
MPFQSEKQRRYLWANEPEIARDWTDTYGSGIAKALGGRIGLYQGGGPHGGSSSSSRSSSGPGPGGQGARGQATQNPGVPSGPGPGGQGVRGQATQNPGITPTRSRIQNERQEDFRKKQMADLLARQQAEKDYNPFGKIKPGPQLGLNARKGPGIGNWASQFAGSKIGGGLGGMLFGPLGMLFGSMLGRGVGKRGYQASQTEEKERLRDILFGENTLLSNLFNKQKTPNTMGGEGLGGIDLSNQDYDKAKTLDARMGMYGSRDRDLSNQGWDQLGTREGPTTRDTWNIKRPITRSNLDTGTVEHDVWGSPLEDYDPRFDINQQYREWMNERMPKTYSEGETIPNPDYYGLDIGRNYLPTDDLQLEVGPYEGERYKITDMENI